MCYRNSNFLFQFFFHVLFLVFLLHLGVLFLYVGNKIVLFCIHCIIFTFLQSAKVISYKRKQFRASGYKKCTEVVIFMLNLGDEIRFALHITITLCRIYRIYDGNNSVYKVIHNLLYVSLRTVPVSHKVNKQNIIFELTRPNERNGRSHFPFRLLIRLVWSVSTLQSIIFDLFFSRSPSKSFCCLPHTKFEHYIVLKTDLTTVSISI